MPLFLVSLAEDMGSPLVVQHLKKLMSHSLDAAIYEYIDLAFGWLISNMLPSHLGRQILNLVNQRLPPYP